jgi:F-type H+-transporting ATPase subunit a
MHQLEQQLFYLFSFLPVSPGVILPWVVTLILVGISFLGTRHLRIVPGPLQSLLEILVEGLESFIGGIVGKKNVKEMVPFFSTIFLYILIADLLGIIPGLKSPTGIFSNCLGMALIIFFMTHFTGFKHHGFGYIKHFIGEPVWLGPLMFPIHVIGELARPLSLTLRLFGNIMGEDVVCIVLTVAIFPLLIPIPILCLMIFTDFIQALVFTILASIYVSGAVGDEEH